MEASEADEIEVMEVADRTGSPRSPPPPLGEADADADGDGDAPACSSLTAHVFAQVHLRPDSSLAQAAVQHPEDASAPLTTLAASAASPKVEMAPSTADNAGQEAAVANEAPRGNCEGQLQTEAVVAVEAVAVVLAAAETEAAGGDELDLPLAAEGPDSAVEAAHVSVTVVTAAGLPEAEEHKPPSFDVPLDHIYRPEPAVDADEQVQPAAAEGELSGGDSGVVEAPGGEMGSLMVSLTDAAVAATAVEAEEDASVLVEEEAAAGTATATMQPAPGAAAADQALQSETAETEAGYVLKGEAAAEEAMLLEEISAAAPDSEGVVEVGEARGEREMPKPAAEAAAAMEDAAEVPAEQPQAAAEHSGACDSQEQGMPADDAAGVPFAVSATTAAADMSALSSGAGAGGDSIGSCGALLLLQGLESAEPEPEPEHASPALDSEALAYGEALQREVSAKLLLLLHLEQQLKDGGPEVGGQQHQREQELDHMEQQLDGGNNCTEAAAPGAMGSAAADASDPGGEPLAPAANEQQVVQEPGSEPLLRWRAAPHPRKGAAPISHTREVAAVPTEAMTAAAANPASPAPGQPPIGPLPSDAHDQPGSSQSRRRLSSLLLLNPGGALSRAGGTAPLLINRMPPLHQTTGER